MARVSGVVEEVTSFKSTAGTIYGVKVNGVNYGTYKEKPACNKGDTVAFEFTVNGKYNNVNLKTFEVIPGVQQEAVIVRPPSSGGYTDKQPIIARQAALNSAAAFMQLIVDADAVPGVTKTSKAEDRFAIIEALFNKKADEFYTASMAGLAPGQEADVPTSSDGSVATEKAAGDKAWA